MTAETIARALGGRRVGQGWMARCPAHADREPSLSIRDAYDRLLVYCHAGCVQRDVIAALKERGLWDLSTRPHLRRIPHCKAPSLQPNERQPNERQADRSVAAHRIWRAALPTNGTPVEAYLAGRGLSLPLPPSLRFHRGLRQPEGGFWPCMVALVTRGADAMPLAIHRTFLARDGSGKAPVKPAKMMLGPCRGGVVRLGEPTEVLMVGEGIETCLAATQATGLPAWAALSTSGLRALELPVAIREVIVLVDGDGPGEAAARHAANRWNRGGHAVRIARPPRNMDFNDILIGLVADDDEGA